MKNYSFLLAIFFGLFACKPQKAKIELPKAEEKLVVSCFISPDDSLITATVRLSKPKFNAYATGPQKGFNDDIQNAKVVISDGAKSTALVFDPLYLFYKATTKQLPIVGGKTYFLKVSTPDGKEISATTTVPADRLSIKQIDIRKTIDKTTELNFEVGVSVNDIPNQTNYVAIGANGYILGSTSNTFIPVDTTDFGGVSVSYFDDDEKVAKTTFFSSSLAGFGYGGDTITKAAINVAVLNCNKDFYLFNRSAALNEFSGGPFSDPVLVYTNITNGFGCFGAYLGTFAHKKVR
jgi:hypothetical protein